MLQSAIHSTIHSIIQSTIQSAIPQSTIRSIGSLQSPVGNVTLFNLIPQLEPVERILHQQLARSFERIILALRVTLPFVGHQDPAEVRMAVEPDAEQVEHFALQPVRR